MLTGCIVVCRFFLNSLFLTLIKLHTTSLSQANSIHTYTKSDRYFNSEGYIFQTQVPISLVILGIDIQDLYTSKYKYTISIEIGADVYKIGGDLRIMTIERREVRVML